jgi:hypothetical protein
MGVKKIQAFRKDVGCFGIYAIITFWLPGFGAFFLLGIEQMLSGPIKTVT